MNFRDFLSEAEIVGGQLMGSEQAALRILTPFRNSNWHFLTLLDGPDHPIHSPQTGSIIDGITIDEFMQGGFSSWQNDDTPGQRHVAVLQVTDKMAAIRCLDGSHQSNPWQWLNFDHDLMRKQAIRNFKDLQPVMYRGQEASPGGAPNWDAIARQAFHGPPMYPKDYEGLSDEEKDAKWRADLAKTIYQDVPDVYAKGHRRDTMYTPKYYQRLGRIMRGGDIDIVADRCPLSKGGFIRVYNPRVVREVRRFQLPSSFSGFRQHTGGFMQATTGTEKERAAVEEKLNDIFQEIGDLPDTLNNDISRVMDSEEMMMYMAGEDVPGIGSFVMDMMYDLRNLEGSMTRLIRGLHKSARVMGMMHARSGQDFSDVWQNVGRYNLEYYKNILSGLRNMSKLIKDMWVYKQGDKYYREEAAKLDKWHASLVRAIMNFADVTSHSTELLRHELGIAV